MRMRSGEGWGREGREERENRILSWPEELAKIVRTLSSRSLISSALDWIRFGDFEVPEVVESPACLSEPVHGVQAQKANSHEATSWTQPNGVFTCTYIHLWELMLSLNEPCHYQYENSHGIIFPVYNLVHVLVGPHIKVNINSHKTVNFFLAR